MIKPATKEQLLDQSIVMSDAWTFLKKYANIEIDDEASWDTLVKEADEICKKHNNNKYVREIIVAVVNEITRLSNSKMQDKV